MVWYSVKRLLQSIVTILIVVSIVFLLLRLMPVESFFPDGQWDKMSWPAKLAILQKLGLYGADGNPLNPFIQLGNYFKSFFTTFNFGQSTVIYVNRNVTDIIIPKMKLSMSFGIVSVIFSLILGYILGISMARFKNSVLDTLGMGYIILARAVPALVLIFVVQFWVTKWLGSPMIYREGVFISYVTPVLCMAILPIANNALWMRRFMVDEFNKDYVKLAYAKGMPQRTVMYRHVLRNAFVPMAYNVPTAILFVLSGSLLVETHFSIPGMGRQLTQAVQRRDNNIVQAIVFVYAVLGILGVFLGDILALVVDPRIKLTSKGVTR